MIRSQLWGRALRRLAILGGLAMVASLLVAGCGGKGASDEKAAPAPVAEVAKPLTLPVGTAFVAALQQAISTGESKVGDKVRLQTLDDVRASDVVVVPAGARIDGEITELHKAERIKQHAELTLSFTQLMTPDGKTYDVTCQSFHLKGTEKKGVVHEVLETSAAVVTKGHQIELPEGQKIKVTLTAPVTVDVKPMPAS
jgi:hypothetical protein